MYYILYSYGYSPAVFSFFFPLFSLCVVWVCDGKSVKQVWHKVVCYGKSEKYFNMFKMQFDGIKSFLHNFVMYTFRITEAICKQYVYSSHIRHVHMYIFVISIS